MGKGWAKGLTAKTDPRVARVAEAHRGLVYERKTPVEQCRWRFLSSRTLPLGWTPEMAYIVGLTATDGCLISGRRQINFKSQDRELVELYLRLLGRSNRVGTEKTAAGNAVYKAHFGDAALYEWLRRIGLMPRKSLVLGAIDAPADLMCHLVRGLLDGDGSILNYRYRGTGKARGVYEALTTCFVSGSHDHIVWLRECLRVSVGISGSVGAHTPTGRTHALYRLAYAKRESERLLPWIYPSASVPCLARKRAIWDDYAARRGAAAVQ